jgi:hypothetical protein
VHEFINKPNSLSEWFPGEPVDQSQTKLNDDLVDVPFAAIVGKFMGNTDSVYKYGEEKKGTITNDEFGDITIQSISSMLKDRFGGSPQRNKTYRYYTFSKSIVNALEDGYRTLEPLHIVKEEEKVEDSTTSQSGDGVTD